MNAGALSERYLELAVANRILFDQDIVDGLGHVSFRDPEDPSRFHLSRALAPGRVTPDDILAFGLDGEPIDARGRSVYQERFIHSEIYRARRRARDRAQSFTDGHPVQRHRRADAADSRGVHVSRGAEF